MMTLAELNKLAQADANAWFLTTCAASNWLSAMVAQRPFRNIAQLTDCAGRIWQTLTEEDYLEAFTAHPMIGDVNSLKDKFAQTKKIAGNEQSGTVDADERVLKRLHQLNHAYLNKHGFIFIICATGLSAATMLAELEKRMLNNRTTELTNAAAEQLKITLIRIQKGLTEQ